MIGPVLGGAGCVCGYLVARRRGCRWMDRLQYGVGHAIAFGLFGTLLCLALDRYLGSSILAAHDWQSSASCPDICPTTLSEVAQVMDGLGSDAERVQPIFISVDPGRDRRLGLNAYTTAFHPAILGLAGDGAQTQAAAESFRVYVNCETEPTAADDYTMAHSPGLFLIGPDGIWLRQYAYGNPASEILSDIKSRF